MSTERRVVLIANADSRRADLFNAALARRGRPPALLIPWIELIAGCDRLDDAIGAGAIVRIESPGRDFEVERHLIARGADEPETEDIAADAIVGAEALQLPFEKGRILYPRQWYRGFRTVLQSLAVKFGGRPGVRILNDPRDVIDLFDKRRGQKRIADAGAAIPLGIGVFIGVLAPPFFYPFSRTVWSAIDLGMTPLEAAELADAAEHRHC